MFVRVLSFIFLISITHLSFAASTDIKRLHLLESIDARALQSAALAKKLWDYAELGYQEEQSTKLVQQTLSDAGFSIRKGVADIPTAFVASYGRGKPVIAILAEFDALPGISQAALPHRSPAKNKANGHACGHNLFATGSIGAAIAVKNWLASNARSATESNTIKGTIRVYGTPAEEGGSGKVYMVRAGLFKDVDIVLHWHPGDRNSAQAATTLANRSAKFRFYGISAHASGAPEKARSALDGVEAFNIMSNMMREHFPQETRMHYVITAGGNAPNVVPDFAEVFYYLRHPLAATVKQMWPRLKAAAQGAALGTGTTVKSEIIHGNHPVIINETLAKMMHEKLTLVGGVKYSEEEKRFASELYKSLDGPSLALGSENKIQPYGTVLGFGSTDVGDVSIAVPTVGLETATWVPGTAAHSWQSTAASGMSIGFKGAQIAAKTLFLAAIELFENTTLRNAATEEFNQRRGGDFVYEALLGDREPPLDYRK
ncbi:MAG: amidohydrolase [Pseudomonadales bacterium]|nr:amidohydrolase [Pseudomonadales bacterium]